MHRLIVLLSATLLFILALSSLVITSLSAVPTFTGDAPADFTGPFAIRLDDPSSSPGAPDVGLPVPPFAANDLSGWDINAVYVEYDSLTDVMYVGIVSAFDRNAHTPLTVGAYLFVRSNPWRRTPRSTSCTIAA